MMTKDEILKLGKIDDEFAKLLKTQGSRPRPTSLANRRDMMHEETSQALSQPSEGVTEFEQAIPMHDGQSIQCYVVKRANSHKRDSPLVLLYFGGGFVSGEARQMVPYARSLARLYSAVCVCVEYRLAPEHCFPISAQDSYAALEWSAKHAASLGANPEKGLIVGGVSAGGNLSSVVAAMAVEKGLTPKVTGQWLSVPCMFEEDTVPKEYKDVWLSREQNAEAPGLNKESMSGMLGLLQPDVRSSWYNPLMSKASVKDLPPAYIQVDGMDPLRDDGIIYADILKKAGVPVRLDAYPGHVHVHWAYPSMDASKRAIMDIIKGFGWLLGQDPGKDEEIVKLVQFPGAG